MSQKNRISKEDFIKNGRDCVLDAIDKYVKQAVSAEDAKGWRDKDLDALIPVLDNHFATVAERFADPDSSEEGSLNIVFPE